MSPAGPPPVLAVTLRTIDGVMLAVLVVLLAILVFLALAETGLTRTTRAKAVSLADEAPRPGRRLIRLVDRPEEFINPLLLVVLMVQSAQTALTTLLAERLFGSAGVVVALAFNVGLVFVLTEAAPKTWAVQHTDRAALLSARPVHAMVRFWPLRMISRGLISLTNVLLPGKGLARGPFMTEEELLATADEAHEAESIDAEERELIQHIIEFGDTIVREVMVPRTDMVSLSVDFGVAEAMEVMLLNGYSRVPVWGEGIDDIVGVVYAKDLMRAERDGRLDGDVRSMSRAPCFVPETKAVAELLREMQAEKFHMALVFDEYGGTAGLVTLEDLIEELVGEIVDEYDVEDSLIEPLPGGGLRVAGRLPLAEANDELDSALPEGEWDTVGGLVFSSLGRVATVGDRVEVGDWALTVDRVQGRRIQRVRITALERPPTDGDATSQGEASDAAPPTAARAESPDG